MAFLKTPAVLPAGAVAFTVVSAGAHSATALDGSDAQADDGRVVAVSQTPATSLGRQSLPGQTTVGLSATATAMTMTDEPVGAETPVVPVVRVDASSQAEQGAQTAEPAEPTTGAVAAVADGSVWDRLAQCESGGDWSIRGGSFSGGLQFTNSTWQAMGGGSYGATAADATREQQIAVAQRLQTTSGWGQWPACSRKLGLR